jgi:RNA polymerase sigma-70 factor, ECF subfamily
MMTNEFLSECMAGDEEAIQMLVRSHQRGVFQVALSILDCSDASQEETTGQAEIATRETFVALLDQLGRYRADSLFETWLYAITIQVSQRRGVLWRRERWFRALGKTLLHPFRRGNRASAAIPEPPAAAEGAPVAQERARRDEALWHAVCGLKEPLRLPVILRYYHDFSVEQIARMLHTGEGAVHARLDMAREKLAAQVGRSTPQPG